MIKYSKGIVPKQGSGYRLLKNVSAWSIYYKFSYNYMINIKIVENSGLSKPGKCNYWLKLNSKTCKFIYSSQQMLFEERIPLDIREKIKDACLTSLPATCKHFVFIWHIRHFFGLKKKDY